MQVEIRAESDEDVPALHDFFRWLKDDQDGPEEVRLGTAAAERPGAMGALEVIQVVLGQSTAAAGLVMQFVSWYRSRGDGRGGAGFTFVRASDGLSVTVRHATDDDVRRILAVLAVPPPEPLPAPDSSARSSE